MRSPDGRRWRAIGALTIVLAATGLGAGGAAQAQDVPDGGDLAEQFGGFTLSGRGNGVQYTYNVENVFPLPAPLFQASLPEAVATMVSGPASTALGSVAYPGNIVGNLPTVIAQSNPDYASYVPPYPIQNKAEYPAGPPTAAQTVGTAASNATASGEAADVTTTMGAGDLGVFVNAGSITASGHSGLVEGAAESRGRSELTDVNLLYGLIHIDSIVTDLVGTTNGTEAATDGGTTVSGATFLGQPITIGPGGVTPGEPIETGPSGPLTPIAGGLAPGVGALPGAIGPVTAPLNDALTQVLGTTGGSINDLLAASGITIRTLEPVATSEGATATRTANGLIVSVRFDGRGDNPLAQVLGAIPSEELPGEGLPGVPLNTSPQALVNLLKETHTTSVALAYAEVSVVSSPAFEFTPPSVPTATGGSTSGSVATPSSGSSGGGFSTPSPVLSSRPGGGGGGTGTPIAATGPDGGVGTAVGVGTLAVLALLLASPAFAFGSTKLADNSLQEATSSCPDGLDGRA